MNKPERKQCCAADLEFSTTWEMDRGRKQSSAVTIRIARSNFLPMFNFHLAIHSSRPRHLAQHHDTLHCMWPILIWFCRAPMSGTLLSNMLSETHKQFQFH